MNILMGILALVFLLGIAFLLSDNKKHIKYRTVAGGLLLQLVIIFFVLRIPVGQRLLSWLADGFNMIIGFGREGISFVFGGLSEQGIFFINVLVLIIFTSSLISVLYYLKIIPLLVKYLGSLIAKVMGTTKAETFSTLGNSFLGGTEAPLLVRPYLPKLTRSELFAVMVGGYGSASAGILAGYVAMGIDMKFLLIAVFTVPFCCLMVAKMVVPETEESETDNIDVSGAESGSLVEAISDGALSGLQLALSVGAVLVAFVGIMALINSFLGVFGTDVSSLVGIIFWPVGYLFNIPQEEIHIFSALLGSKLAVNEFVAYEQLVSHMPVLSPRTIAILSVVICNFANLSTIAIQTAGFGIFAPNRKGEVAKQGFKALLCGTIATLTTGAIVGMFL